MFYPKKVQKDKIKIYLEKIFYSLERDPENHVDIEFKDELKYLYKKFVNNGNQACNTKQNQSLHSTLNNLARNNWIIICRFDKRNGVAILNEHDYFIKLDSIIMDTTKFVEVPVIDNHAHSIITTENSVGYYIKKYLKV